MAGSFRTEGTYAVQVRGTQDYGIPDDPGLESNLVKIVASLRSQSRRRLGPGRSRFSSEGLRDPHGPGVG